MKGTVFWGCNSERFGDSLIFRRNILVTSEGLKSKLRKKPAETGQAVRLYCAESYCCLLSKSNEPGTYVLPLLSGHEYLYPQDGFITLETKILIFTIVKTSNEISFLYYHYRLKDGKVKHVE
jgi:hypothetical protein